MNGLTVRIALDTLGATDERVALAITGAAGAVGGYAIQLAKLEGLTVIADAAPADESLIRGLGADVVVPRGGDVCAAAIREAFADGVDAVLDAALLRGGTGDPPRGARRRAVDRRSGRLPARPSAASTSSSFWSASTPPTRPACASWRHSPEPGS